MSPDLPKLGMIQGIVKWAKENFPKSDRQNLTGTPNVNKNTKNTKFQYFVKNFRSWVLKIDKMKLIKL